MVWRVGMSDPGYLLIPGGGMSDWVWRDLDPAVRRCAIPVDRRLQNNTTDRRRSATIHDCVRYILRLVDDAGHSELVIVAHSGGGILAPLVAQECDDRILGIVFVAANIPRTGSNAVSSLPFPARLINRLAVRSQLRFDSVPIKAHEGVVRERFCNTASETVIRYVLDQRLTSEPLCLLYERVDWSLVPKVPMTYFRLLRDRTASLKLQDRMAANLGIDNVRDIDSDHMVMLSHPRDFNDALRVTVSDFLQAT
jgi:pimeloyl-ACP methyl ester carboxylesterase